MNQDVKDILFLISLLPGWAITAEPGLDPTMYGTCSYEGDLKVIDRIKAIKDRNNLSSSSGIEMTRAYELFMVKFKELDQIIIAGKDETDEGGQLRDDMDLLWDRMTQKERDIAQDHAAKTFYVVCDQSNNSQEDIDNKLMNAHVFVRNPRTELNLVITPLGARFEDLTEEEVDKLIVEQGGDPDNYLQEAKQVVEDAIGTFQKGDGQRKKQVEITHTNWRGERSTRRIIPESIKYGSNQWQLSAFDVETGINWEFAVKDISSWREVTNEEIIC